MLWRWVYFSIICAVSVLQTFPFIFASLLFEVFDSNHLSTIILPSVLTFVLMSLSVFVCTFLANLCMCSLCGSYMASKMGPVA